MVFFSEGGGFGSAFDVERGLETSVISPVWQPAASPPPVEGEPVVSTVIGQELIRLTEGEGGGDLTSFAIIETGAQIQRLPTREVAADIQVAIKDIGGTFPVISSPTLRFDSDVPTIQIEGVEEIRSTPAQVSGPGIFSDQLPAFLKQGRAGFPGSSDPALFGPEERSRLRLQQAGGAVLILGLVIAIAFAVLLRA